MNKGEDLRKRTKEYSVRIIRVAAALPKTSIGKIIADQLARSGTSVGANYRIVCRARSTAEFLAKLGIVIEEADESAFWLECIIDHGLLKEEQLVPLLKETNEIISIMVASSNSARKNQKNKSKQ